MKTEIDCFVIDASYIIPNNLSLRKMRGWFHLKVFCCSSVPVMLELQSLNTFASCPELHFGHIVVIWDEWRGVISKVAGMVGTLDIPYLTGLLNNDATKI